MKNSDMLNNLYKILRMNIILANSDGEIVSEDTLQNFDDTAKKIDESSINEFERKINDFYYPTKSLDEEAERLENLIGLIDRRIDERKSLMLDYHEVTGKNLEPLGYIKDEDKVEDYRNRLNNIKSYLSNKENIAKIEEELIELGKNLDKNFEDKKADEENNTSLENDLLSAFKDAVSNTDYFKVTNVVDVNLELEKLNPLVKEQLKTLSTFDNAYNNLLRAGISRENETEYAGYVREAKKSYYEIKEKEYLYRIFKIILDSKKSFGELYSKRNELDELLEERLKLRIDMSILDDDILSSLYDVIDKQNQIIAKQKNVIDNIAEIEDTIKFKKMRLNELIEDNKRVEILSLLQEFGIIDTYKDNLNLDNKETEENTVDNNIDNSNDNIEVSVPNMVVDVKDAYANLNIVFARSKADTVMRRVGKSLGYNPEPKKENIVSFDFNNQEVKDNVEDVIIKDEIKEEPPVVNNSLSSLNLDDLNLNLKLDNKESIDEKINDYSESMVNPIFPDLPMNVNDSNSSNDADPVANNINQNLNVDKDFWSADEDKKIFPSSLTDKEITINKDESGFKLGNPINIGGYDENRN